MRASPSRLGEDVGDGLLLLPGLYGPDRAYTLEGPDDRLIQLAVPIEADEERRPPTSSTPVEVAVPSSLADGAGTGSHVALLVAPPAAGAAPPPPQGGGGGGGGGDRQAGAAAAPPSGRLPFSDVRLPPWERLPIGGVARQLYGMARAEAAAHRVTWQNDALRERRRWSLRAMLRGLLAPSVGEDAALAAVGVLPTPAPAVTLSDLLDSLLVLPPTPDDDSAVAASNRGSNPASHAAGAIRSTPSAAGAPTPPASSCSSGAGSRRPTPPPRYASTGAASTSTSSSTDDWRKRADTLFTRLFALGTLGLVLEAAIDPTYEERGDVTSPATLLYHEWVNDVAYAEGLLTSPAAASTVAAARRGVAILRLLERIYRAPAAETAAFYAAPAAMTRMRAREALDTPPSPPPSPPASTPPVAANNTTVAAVAAAAGESTNDGQHAAGAAAEGSVEGGHAAATPATTAAEAGVAEEGSDDEQDDPPNDPTPWPFVAAAVVLCRHGCREDWSGDTEVPVRQVGAYSAEGIRRLVCRGLMLVQGTTYVYALAGAVATELLA